MLDHKTSVNTFPKMGVYSHRHGISRNYRAKRHLFPNVCKLKKTQLTHPWGKKDRYGQLKNTLHIMILKCDFVKACEMYPNLDLEGNMQPEIYIPLINVKN